MRSIGSTSLVIAGPDPAIHDEALHALTFRLDHRVKPGDDEVGTIKFRDEVFAVFTTTSLTPE